MVFALQKHQVIVNLQTQSTLKRQFHIVDTLTKWLNEGNFVGCLTQMSMFDWLHNCALGQRVSGPGLYLESLPRLSPRV